MSAPTSVRFVRTKRTSPWRALSRRVSPRRICRVARWAKCGGAKAQFQHAKLFDCDLSRASFAEAVFYKARLQMCELAGTVLTEANLSNCQFLDCQLPQADLTGARMQGADLSRSQFDRAFLDNCDLREAKMPGCDFSRASLQGARLGGVQWSGADLRGANLRGARDLTPDQLSQERMDSTTTLPTARRVHFCEIPGPRSRGSQAVGCGPLRGWPRFRAVHSSLRERRPTPLRNPGSPRLWRRRSGGCARGGFRRLNSRARRSRRLNG
ncbi:MAG: pentapeptide repeat-containing protein [Acidobacteria bacterium]|nr:pentapeptide repeat-containing protein [Acidobacteriota bacterium]